MRKALGIYDQEVIDFVESIDLRGALNDEKIPSTFKRNFIDWIGRSENNRLRGLSKFTNVRMTSGSIQSFDHWYWKHKNRRIRFYRGEFMYHQAVQKNGGRWEEYATGFDMHNEIFRLEKDDALVISVPFSDTGKQRDDLGYALSHAKRMNIPVLLDFCYYPVTKNINIDLDLYPNIDTITFSMSKIFKGAESLRVGVRMEREDRDDGIDVFNSVGMYNNIALKILNEYMEEYDVDYCWRKYKNKYEQACQELNLKPTDCVLFGLGGDEYSDFNRGNEHNRVCVSQRLGQS